MARTIPDSIPSKASAGEKLLFKVLCDRLPDDFIVWYEPEVNAFYPDFVILAPTFGILILEVKGWYANRIDRADRNFFEMRHKNKDGIERVVTKRSPLKQAGLVY